ncbi:hypothetical protein GCM10010485_50190 [Streptosporangium carneum]
MGDQRGRVLAREPGLHVVAQVTLDLPDPLPGHGEALGQVVQRGPLRGVQAVPGDRPLPVVQGREDLVDQLRQRPVGPGGTHLGDALLGDRLEEAFQHPGEQFVHHLASQPLGGPDARSRIGEPEQGQHVAEHQVSPARQGEVRQTSGDLGGPDG